jgi:lipopolysaccharide export system permease protein
MTLIIIVFDTSERIDDFVQKDAPLKEIIVDYYGNYVPYLISMFSGLFAFIAVIFFTSKMAGHTEIVAMLSSGISYRRIMRPYLMVATLIALANCYLTNIIIPIAAQKRYEFEVKYLKHPYNNTERNIHRQTQRGNFAYIETFRVQDQTAYKFSLETVTDGQLRSKLTSNYARWDTAQSVWRVYDFIERVITDSGEVIRKGAEMDTLVNLTGTDLSVRVNRIMVTMNYRELNEYIAMLRLQGAGATNVNEMLNEKHKRFANPMASIILTIIGLCLSSRKVRGGMGLHIGLGVGLSFAYILFQRFSEMFVQAGTLPAAIALWLPNILFLLVGFWLYLKTPK